MKIKKILFATFLLIVMSMAMSACSNNQSNSGGDPASATNAPGVADNGSTPELRPSLTDKRIKITVNDTDVVYANLADSHATNIFIENLPFTIEMDDYISRNKRGTLPFTIAEEDQQNIIYPHEIGDIIYYPPTRLLGIFYDHNGNEISAGYELVAQMDSEGIDYFKQLPTDVNITVTVELENSPSASGSDTVSATNTQDTSDDGSTPELRPSLTDKKIKITVNDTDVVYANLADSHATNIFIENLPFTIEMDDYISRNKRGTLPFTIAAEDQQNIIYPHEIGDIIYYPPTRLLGIFYDHNGNEISAGYELVAQMDDEGIDYFKQLPTNVNITVTVELSE